MSTRSRRRIGRLSPSQARSERRRRRQRRRRFLRFGAFFGIGTIAFIFIISLFAPSLSPFIGTAGPTGDAGEPVGLPSGYEPGTLRGGTPHLEDLDQSHPRYSSIPATSGWHVGFTARWGVHDDVLPDEVLVHNLEHAGVGIHYNCPDGCTDMVADLVEIVSRRQNDWVEDWIQKVKSDGDSALVLQSESLKNSFKVVLSPYPNMDNKITLTAWGYIDRFDVFDRSRIIKFIKAHVNSTNAPEPFAR